MKNKLLIILASTALVAIVGIVAGLGLAGAFNSEDTSSARANNPASIDNLKPLSPTARADPERNLVQADPNYEEELRQAFLELRNGTFLNG